MRAAAKGIIDFTKARVLDVSWWRRTNALISTMATDDRMAIVRAAFDLQRSLVGNSGLTKESFERSQKTAQSFFGDIIDTLQPWATKEATAKKANEITGLVDQYKKLVGDPDDLEFQRKMLHDAKLLEQRESQPELVEDDNSRIDRLLKEREAYYDRVRNRTVR